jgi:glucosylceramidase
MYTYDDSDTPDPDLTKFSIDHDRAYIIPVLKEILEINPRVTVMASPWSAPAWMKTSDYLTFGSLLPQYESAYANYLVKFLQAYRDEGIAIPFITVANEPEFEPVFYPGMKMTADQQTRLLRDDLAPALAAARLNTKVLVYDHNWNDTTFPLQVLSDPGAAAISAGVAFHCYAGSQQAAQDAVHAAIPSSKVIWETECSGGEWQGTRQQAFNDEASLVVNGSEHWSNATLLWNLALDPDNGPHFNGCATCRGMLTINGNTWQPEVDRDVLAQIGRWVPVGSVRVKSADTGTGLTSTAYRAKNGRVILLLHNQGAARTAAVTQGRARFTVDLPAGSLTTLRWAAS